MRRAGVIKKSCALLQLTKVYRLEHLPLSHQLLVFYVEKISQLFHNTFDLNQE